MIKWYTQIKAPSLFYMSLEYQTLASLWLLIQFLFWRMGTWLNQPIILSHYNWTLNGIEATSQQEVLISYREYHAGNCILSIWTSLPTRLLFDWPTVHPSNRSFVTIIIDSCPIFWTRFFNWKIPLLLTWVHYGLRLTEIVSIKCFEKLAHKSARRF